MALEVEWTYLVQSMATFWDNMRFLAGKSKAKAKRFETDGTLVLLLWNVVARDYGQGSSDHVRVRVRGGTGIRGKG